MNVQLNISVCVAKKAFGIYIAPFGQILLWNTCTVFCTVMRRALFVEWLRKQSAVFILKLSFAHIKHLFPFAWFSHSSVCAFWGHFSKWCRYSFAVFWCYILCLTYIFSTCKCCNYSDCLYSCATHHSFSDWYCKNYFIRYFRKELVIA